MVVAWRPRSPPIGRLAVRTSRRSGRATSTRRAPPDEGAHGATGPRTTLVPEASRMSPQTNPAVKDAAEGRADPTIADRSATSTEVDVTASWATSLATRRAMQANRRRDTSPELAVRRLVHAAGLRYRVDARPMPAARHRADMIFTRARVAVFVDGCWWHGCPKHYRPPTSNAAYWAGKVTRNRERDRLADEALSAAGWAVIRIWEHEPAEPAAQRIVAAVRGSTEPGDSI